jgi:hypothetical protein
MISRWIKVALLPGAARLAIAELSTGGGDQTARLRNVVGPARIAGLQLAGYTDSVDAGSNSRRIRSCADSSVSQLDKVM